MLGPGPAGLNGSASGNSRLQRSDMRRLVSSATSSRRCREAAGWRRPASCTAKTGVTSAAAALPGVPCVLTARDLPSDLNVWTPLPLRGHVARPLAHPVRPALAGRRVLHVGEPIALVVARTAEIAADAVELVEVEYRSLAAVVDGLDALQLDLDSLAFGEVDRDAEDRDDFVDGINSGVRS